MDDASDRGSSSAHGYPVRDPSEGVAGRATHVYDPALSKRGGVSTMSSLSLWMTRGGRDGSD